jgi:hypothetical protein
MPVNAIAFVFGIWVLQQQPALLPAWALGVLGDPRSRCAPDSHALPREVTAQAR